jgi:adenylosuccinate synthase
VNAVVIAGAQWGDEGKGKVIDLFTEAADWVVRFAGGPNAGHTLVVGDEKVVVRLIPSGILRPKAKCVMAQGMVVDLGVLFGEIDALQKRGTSTEGRLFLSDRAHVILPYHPLIDGLREGAAREGEKIGTTKRGIGPCYEDKIARRGIRVSDLFDESKLRNLVDRALESWTPTIRALGGEVPRGGEIVDGLLSFTARLAPITIDTAKLVDDAIKSKARVLFEGAQGTMLDVDHGTYPFVTSSSAVAGGACVGAGVGPTRIGRVVGISKGYATRVGEGPFPTELFDAIGERIRVAGGEFGSVTGRPRRTGWIDLPALRHAARVNGLDGLALTKLDVLAGLDEVKACVAYRTNAGETRELPVDALATATPVFKTFPGWTEALTTARKLDDLPKSTRAFVQFIEEETGVAVDLVSVGPRRDETIVLRAPFV